MSKLQRRIYSALLRLHPAAFRRQFGRDMARDCEDAIRDRGFAVLIGDAFLSLARQWKSRALAGPEPETEPAVAGHPFLSGQYIVVTHGSSLTAFDLVSASALSILLLLTIGYAASMPNRRAIANQQTATASHDGGIDTGRNAAPRSASTGANRERDGAGIPLEIDGGSGLQPARRFLRRPSTLAYGHGPRARRGPPARPITLADAAAQFALISIIVWLTSLLLRRTPGAGRRIVLGGLGLLCVAASVAFGQPPAAPAHSQILHTTSPLPSFEVATVRPWQPAPSPPLPPGAPVLMPVKIAPGSGANKPVSDQVHFIGQVSLLIAQAYNLRVGTESSLIVGLPAWADSEADRYKVDAKIDGSLYSTIQTMSLAKQHEEVQLMQQSLLADRFRLKAHFETRMMPAYSMVIGKGGPKLNPAKPGETLWLTATSTPNGTKLTARAATLEDWIDSPFLSRLDVVNETGLHGAYDFNLLWTSDQQALNTPSGSNSDAPSIFIAIQEQLGLKLVPTKAPVEVIVIDHIEKPTEN